MRRHDWSLLSSDERISWLRDAYDRRFASRDWPDDAPPGTRFELPGHLIVDLSSLLCAFGEAVNGPHGYFGQHLLGFEDCLYGGFGASKPSTVAWIDADASRVALGYEAMVAWARNRLDADDYFDDDGKAWLETAVERARRNEGDTLFDCIIGTITWAGWSVELWDGEGRLLQTLT